LSASLCFCQHCARLRRRRRPSGPRHSRKPLFRQHFPKLAPGAHCIVRAGRHFREIVVLGRFSRSRRACPARGAPGDFGPCSGALWPPPEGRRRRLGTLACFPCSGTCRLRLRRTGAAALATWSAQHRPPATKLSGRSRPKRASEASSSGVQPGPAHARNRRVPAEHGTKNNHNKSRRMPTARPPGANRGTSSRARISCPPR